MKSMTDEMIEAAFILQDAANKYKDLCEKEHGKMPVVWVKNVETGEAIFISDSFNAERLIDFLRLA